MTDKKVSIDADVAAWVTSLLFPPPDPETGQQGGVTVNGVPGTVEFDRGVDLFTRARTQLAP